MKRTAKVIPIINLIITLSLFISGGCSNVANTLPMAASTPASTLLATATPTFTTTATATRTPTRTRIPTVTLSPTATLYGGASSNIIMLQKEANLSGRRNLNNGFYSIVIFNYKIRIKAILAKSDGKTTTYASSSVSPDGEYLYLDKSTLVQTSFGYRWNSILYQMNLTTRKLTRLSETLQFYGNDDPDSLLIENDPDISKDGKLLVFDSNRGYLPSIITYIFVMDMSDASIKRIPNTPLLASNPKFSPDGKMIAFNGWDGKDWEIYIINLDGTGLQELTENTTDDRYPDWSPDGTKLVFQSSRDGNVELYIYDLTSKETTRVTKNPGTDATANWSPDGKMLVFTSDRDGYYDPYAINIETGAEYKLYDSAIEETVPLWVP